MRVEELIEGREQDVMDWKASRDLCTGSKPDSAMYPLWKIQESSLYLYWLCKYNPFTFAVEMLRFSLYEQYNVELIALVSGVTLFCAFFAINTFKAKK